LCNLFPILLDTFLRAIFFLNQTARIYTIDGSVSIIISRPQDIITEY
jgi:hypothetical protein